MSHHMSHHITSDPAADLALQERPQPAVLPEMVATAWAALAKDPLAVLETEYVHLVRASERRSLRETEGTPGPLARLFAQGMLPPAPLVPVSLPLVEDRLQVLSGQFELVCALQATCPAETCTALQLLVGEIAITLALMTGTATLAHSGAGVREAAAWLGLPGQKPEEAAATWAAAHADPAQIAAYLDEVEDKLLAPLQTQEEATDAVRALSHIAPFYLFQLMHRFQGDETLTPMDLPAAPEAPCPAAADWLSGWHEDCVVDLKNRLRALNCLLRKRLNCNEDVLRYFLKGGRALYTSLGQAAGGAQDWDTGILINPGLAPQDWYRAFAAVNDLVLRFLEQARYAYSTLLRRHSEEPASAAQPAAQIDIGIARRQSPELTTQWLGLEIVERPGLLHADLPVPSLPWFVDELTHSLRGLLNADQFSTRKTARRLLRLQAVLGAADPALEARLGQMQDLSCDALYYGSAAFGVGLEDPVARLRAWGLGALLASLPQRHGQPGWLTGFDAWLQAKAPDLLDPALTENLWQQIRAAIPLADQPCCRALLVTLQALRHLSRHLAGEEAVIAAALAPQSPPGQGLRQVMAKIFEQNARGRDGIYYLTGSAAAALQSGQALPGAGADGSCEIVYRPRRRAATEAFGDLTANLSALLPALGLTLSCCDGVLRIHSITPLPGLQIAAERPVLLQITADTDRGTSIERLQGWPVASPRDLLRLFRNRAAQSPDPDFRQRRCRTADALAAIIPEAQLR